MFYPITRKLTLLLILFATFLTACDSNNSSSGTFYGQQKKLGDGKIRTFVDLGDDGEPTAYGVAFDEKALTGLPTGGDHSNHGNMTVLQLPDVAEFPTDHISVDWNPNGHEPEGIYTHPHFDFHFYMITEAYRNAMVPADPEYEAKSAKLPEAQYIPQGYVSPPGNLPVPQMGLHWLDPASPELNGATFTKTFIHGSWDGNIIFYEPMITKAFIESVKGMDGQAVVTSIPQPQAFAKPGYYPTTYAVRYDAKKKEYRVALEGLVRR